MSVLENFLAEAESWVGTPYFTEACTKGVKGGANCGSWFMDVILKTLPNTEDVEYAKHITHAQYYKKNIDVMPEMMDHIAFRITMEELKPGDVVFPRIRRVAAIPAIYVGDDQFIYCDVSQKIIVKNTLLENLLSRVMYVYRFNVFAEES